MGTPELTIKVNATRAISDAMHNGGFLKLDQIESIAAEPTTRLTPMLVRCGGGRFTCPAQNTLHFIGIIEAHAKAFPGDSDYVRDVSLSAGFAVQGGSK